MISQSRRYTERDDKQIEDRKPQTPHLAILRLTAASYQATKVLIGL
jgi:hypothetical protein